ncbi:hypothetical protein CH359_10285 [Leptospira meyeri]|nr:hypothetical protein CH359_10285 [Leptospira meyeri]PJZ96257.1 hypothetical protein CH358_11955 [Leptospira meyeri]PKA11116.1 hypothetical protein CH372_16005 [Leptospira meyeri]PKA26827.1 hypothetical protein CH381_08710 [Leptospira sp. mixed culture ATI2-C-A1]
MAYFLTNGFWVIIQFASSAVDKRYFYLCIKKLTKTRMSNFKSNCYWSIAIGDSQWIKITLGIL